MAAGTTTPPTRDRGRYVRPFLGFYRPQGAGVADLDPLSRFLYAARSVILVISAQAALIAGLLALTDRRFHALDFVLVLVGLVVAHAISNLSNDYFGFRRGHDTPDSPRLRYTVHPLASGALAPRALLTGIVALAVVDVGIAAYFTAVRGLGALAFVLAGAALLFLYDAAPITLKAIGLGELASFVVWGPLMVGGGYYVITGGLSTTAFLASVPYGLGVMSILVGKHIDQLDFDKGKGQRTLPVVLGTAGARLFNRGAVVGMYVMIVGLVATGRLTVFTLLAFLAAPRAVRAVDVMSRPRPDGPPAGYVGWPLWYHRVCLVHDRLFGWVYLAGLALGAAFPGVRVH